MIHPRFLPLYSVLLLAACGGTKPVTEEQQIVVEVAQVSGGAATSVITGTGSLEREREVVLSFRVPGVVRQLTVDNGDAVAKGRLIASLDPTQVAARAQQTTADYAKALRDLERDKKLAAEGWISAQRLADRQTAVQSTKAALESANFDRRSAQLLAPVGGVVLKRFIQSGEVVGAGQPVVSIADARAPLVVRVSLADRDVARVKLGDPARVTVSAIPGLQLAGSVSRIDSQVDARTGATDVDVRVPSVAGLKTGFVADVAITLRTMAVGSDMQSIPAEAIVEANGTNAVVLVVNMQTGIARRTTVTFHGFENDDAKVTGLPANARVITSGGALVRDGNRVSVTQQAAG